MERDEGGMRQNGQDELTQLAEAPRAQVVQGLLGLASVVEQPFLAVSRDRLGRVPGARPGIVGQEHAGREVARRLAPAVQVVLLDPVAGRVPADEVIELARWVGRLRGQKVLLIMPCGERKASVVRSNNEGWCLDPLYYFYIFFDVKLLVNNYSYH